MNYELKELIDSICSAIEAAVKSIPEIGQDGGDALARIDIAKFMMYLSASDGEIKWEEAEAISFYCGLDITPNTLGQFIRENNIYSTEFESTAPATLQLLVLLSNALDNPEISEGFITTCNEIGKQLILSDGYVNDNEVSDYNIYINMMERYLDENLDSRKSVISGFVKPGGSVSAPSKSSVMAPKKG